MSASWLTGGCVWSRVMERHLSASLMHAAHEEAATRAMHRCARTWRTAAELLGPASGATAVWWHLVRPCAEALGWAPGDDVPVIVGGIPMREASASLGALRQTILSMPWGMGHEGLQRAATRVGAERGTPWVAVCNGLTWRWYDATRPFTRVHIGVDLTHAAIDARVWQALWLMAQPGAADRTTRSGGGSLIERLIASSTHERTGSTKALRDGVLDTLAQLDRHAAGDRDAHVTLVFQWLFLLFAESRALAPLWHPAYRRSYSIATLARECRARRRTPTGVHESLVAIGRAGRDGMQLGGARLGALNGPLFAGTLVARRGSRISDEILGAMLTSLTCAPGSGDAFDFAQLGVDQLGTLYERLLSPASVANGPELLRKRTGAFYTPPEMADTVVERTLDPLVRSASAEQVLGLRILDPAMGSGALLAAAHRYLVSAVEAAWVREGRGGPLDVPRDERESLPRRVAEQCLYGVDIDARAVQVARLSLWLQSLAPDRPLTWLDAHLCVGNSLAGVSPATLLRPPAAARTPLRSSQSQLTLFDIEHWHHEADEVGPLLAALAARPTLSADDAHDKTRTLHELRGREGMSAWHARADAWCGAVMQDEPPAQGVWRAVDDALRAGGRATTRVAPAEGCVAVHAERWRALARSQQCLHWNLAFPEIFETGRGGFDAVIANPPWEMLRGDLGTTADRAERRGDIAPLMRFVRRSGVYRDTGGHVNSYQLFLERMLQLVRTGGRIGCLLPGGILADHGAAALRRHLFDRADIDRITVFDNRDALFPIHRSMRIVAVTGQRGSATTAVLVDEGESTSGRRRTSTSGSEPRLLSRAMLRRASGESEAIPSVRSAAELAVLERLIQAPRLGGGWRLRFGRELNATEDRHLFRDGSAGDVDALHVVDGKHMKPFTVRPPDTPWIAAADAKRVLPDAPWEHWRLAYRDVSSATNTRSLICALLPPGCVSTHTLFCLRTRAPLSVQVYLCGMLNSLVADWFVRRFLASHVTTRLIAHVPVPLVIARDTRRRRVVRLATRLLRASDDADAFIALQAEAAGLYGLDRTAMTTVLGDFPRLPDQIREGALRLIAARPSTR